MIGAWDVFDVRRDGARVAFGSPQDDQYLTAQLQRGIAAVTATGSKVALLEVPCYRNVDGGGLVALPERSDDQRTSHLNTLLRAAAAADPQHVVFVAGPKQWCSDPSIATDLGYRWDGVHYYRPGAKLVFDTITPALLQIPLLTPPGAHVGAAIRRQPARAGDGRRRQGEGRRLGAEGDERLALVFEDVRVDLVQPVGVRPQAAQLVGLQALPGDGVGPHAQSHDCFPPFSFITSVDVAYRYVASVTLVPGRRPLTDLRCPR